MHIDFALGAGTDADAVIGEIIEGEAGFDMVDVDQHIRDLSGNDRSILLSLGTAGHGDTVADLGARQNSGPVLDRIEIAAEQFADDIGIGPAAAQVRRGIKGADAGLDSEVLSVDDDAA